MKKLFIMMAGLLFAVSTAFASPSTQSDVVTMSKADSQALFGDSSVSVVALGSDEMKATEGEFWPIIAALTVGWASESYVNAPTWNRPRWGYSRSYIYNHPRNYYYRGYYTYSYNPYYWSY